MFLFINLSCVMLLGPAYPISSFPPPYGQNVLVNLGLEWLSEETQLFSCSASCADVLQLIPAPPYRWEPCLFAHLAIASRTEAHFTVSPLNAWKSSHEPTQVCTPAKVSSLS